jgi:Asp-tRNA(Asn)/Glu-tRNA(Gln) amidotransferase A subunit family amidase
VRRKNDEQSLAKLREIGVNLIPLELPSLPVNDLAIILEAEAAAAFDDITRTGKDDLMKRQEENAWPNVFRASRFIPAVEYIQANRVRYLLIQQMQKVLESVDLYVAPSYDGNNLLLTNLTGHPCVVVPNGFSPENTPTSFTFCGKLYDEGTVLAVAKKYQDSTGFHLKHPLLKE